MLPPLVFEPYLRERIWGGTRLRDQLGKTLPGDDAYGESWEIAALPEHDSVVCEGPLAGTKLSVLWDTRRPELIGDATPPYGGVTFPLLIKWLDCSQTLSVQVHPDDAGAQAILNEPCGKAESWIMFDTTPDAVAFYGLKAGTTPDEFNRRLKDGTVAECLGTIQPQRGEIIDVPRNGARPWCGTACARSRTAERRDLSGLRLEPRRPRWAAPQAASGGSGAGIDWNRCEPPPAGRVWSDSPVGVTAQTLVETPSFQIHRFEIAGDGEFANPFPGELVSWTVLFGAGTLTASEGYQRPLNTGETVLTSASTANVVWRRDRAEPLTLIAATMPR
ncbi:MAG: type I phosphomannose isomerase catalytic subunit [Planctomycetaceae bacterium]